jgi:hypothetical protein
VDESVQSQEAADGEIKQGHGHHPLFHPEMAAATPTQGNRWRSGWRVRVGCVQSRPCCYPLESIHTSLEKHEGCILPVGTASRRRSFSGGHVQCFAIAQSPQITRRSSERAASVYAVTNTISTNSATRSVVTPSPIASAEGAEPVPRPPVDRDCHDGGVGDDHQALSSGFRGCRYSPVPPVTLTKRGGLTPCLRCPEYRCEPSVFILIVL